jgi:hypothetical protein
LIIDPLAKMSLSACHRCQKYGMRRKQNPLVQTMVNQSDLSRRENRFPESM